MTLFDDIGATYNTTRQADERIVAALLDLLGLQSGSSLADIGAGTGNYTLALAEAGFKVKAIEPSAGMTAKSRQHPNVAWLTGFAEDVPLRDGIVDGVVSILAVPHFSDLQSAFQEMARISERGPVVLFTFDPRIGRKTWQAEYFPYMWNAFDNFPPLEEIAQLLHTTVGLNVHIVPFRLPPDLKDNFAAAAWSQPHRYLDEQYRANISSFRVTERETIAASVTRLKEDLNTGRWHALHGEVLRMEELDAGYRFLCAK